MELTLIPMGPIPIVFLPSDWSTSQINYSGWNSMKNPLFTMEKSKSFFKAKFCKPSQITLSRYHKLSNPLFHTFTATTNTSESKVRKTYVLWLPNPWRLPKNPQVTANTINSSSTNLLKCAAHVVRPLGSTSSILCTSKSSLANQEFSWNAALNVAL